MNRLFVLVLCAPRILCGCESTGVGNPGLTVTAVNTLSSEPDATTDPTDSITAELRHAALAFSELRWLPCDSVVAPAVMQGPFVVDLVSGKATPDFPAVAIPAGGFCGLDALLATGASDPVMQGKSVLLSGVRTDGTLFILYAAMTGSIKMRPYPSNTVWDESNAGSVIWALRPTRWLTRSEVNAEPAEPLGTRRSVIAIDVNRHPMLYEAIRSRIGSRSSLNTDLDGDHQLGPDEETAFIGVGLPSLD